MDSNPPGSSVRGIPQARILAWVAISFSRGSSRPRDQTCASCIAGGFFTAEPLGKPEEAEASSKKHYPGQALEASGITQERRAETEGEEVKLRWFGGSEHFWRQKHGVQRCPRSEMRLEGMGVNWIDLCRLPMGFWTFC